MNKLLILFILLYSQAIAAVQGPIIWGNDNNALYLPTNKPSSGTACLVVDPIGTITPTSCGGGGGSGTVTSVGWGSTPSWLVGTGGPITTSGTLGLAVPSQSPNKFLASPNGSTGALSPRSIVAADVPTLNQNTTGSAGSLNTTFSTGNPLIGQGTGVPAMGTKTGITTKFATANGSWTVGNGVKIGTNGDLEDTGNPVGQAAGYDKSVQYKGAGGNFAGDAYLRYDYNTHALYAPDIYMAQGSDKPAGFTHDNKIEPWDRTGTHKTLVNTDDSPIVPGFCYVFDAQGNFVSSGIACMPVSGSRTITITTDYTPNASDIFILANCATQCQVNLPDTTTTSGYKIAMKNIGSANAIFHNMTGQKIDGQDDWGLLPDREQVNLISVGSQWYVY